MINFCRAESAIGFRNAAIGNVPRMGPDIFSRIAGDGCGFAGINHKDIVHFAIAVIVILFKVNTLCIELCGSFKSHFMCCLVRSVTVVGAVISAVMGKSYRPVHIKFGTECAVTLFYEIGVDRTNGIGIVAAHIRGIEYGSVIFVGVGYGELYIGVVDQHSEAFHVACVWHGYIVGKSADSVCLGAAVCQCAQYVIG